MTVRHTFGLKRYTELELRFELNYKNKGSTEVYWPIVDDNKSATQELIPTWRIKYACNELKCLIALLSFQLCLVASSCSPEVLEIVRAADYVRVLHLTPARVAGRDRQPPFEHPIPVSRDHVSGV